MKKRTLILTVVLCFVSIIGMGQSSGTYTAKRTKVKTVKTNKYVPKFEKGWNLCPEIGIGIPIQFEFLCSARYQINPYLNVGFGTGIGSFQFLGYSLYGYTYYPNDIWYSTTFPVFVTFRTNLLTTKNGFTPFFETKMGYAFGLWGKFYDINVNDYYVREYEKPSGLYGHLGIGVNYKNFNLLLSYHIKQVDFYCYHSYNSYTERFLNFSHNFSISLAYNIPLKKKQ